MKMIITLRMKMIKIFKMTQVGLEGKSGATYKKWGGLCLMTQNYRL